MLVARAISLSNCENILIEAAVIIIKLRIKLIQILLEPRHGQPNYVA